MKTRYNELRADCNRFHRKNPKVWALFQKFTFQLIRRRFRHYSVMGVISRIRWETDVPNPSGGSEFKMNNNYSPFYARRFHKEFPDHDDFFRLREQSSKKAPPVNRDPLGPDDFPYVKK